jgi:hypothetical protein
MVRDRFRGRPRLIDRRAHRLGRITAKDRKVEMRSLFGARNNIEFSQSRRNQIPTSEFGLKSWIGLAIKP